MPPLARKKPLPGPANGKQRQVSAPQLGGLAEILRTEYVSVRGLQTYYRNPRVGDLALIAESLEQNGQFRAIVVNIGTYTHRKNEVLAGNHTLLAARHLGWSKIWASFVDVSEDRATRIVLVDNRAADAGTYDAKELDKLLASLPDVVGTGFSDAEVQALADSIPKLVVSDDMIPTINIADLGLGPKPRDRREVIIDERDEDVQDAIHNRGAGAPPPIEQDTAIEEIETEDFAEQRKLAEIQAVLELREGELWYGDNEWQIPDLRADMLVESVPSNIRCWGGKDVTPDDGRQWYLYNYSLGGMSGLPVDRSTLCFYCVDTETEALTKRGWLNHAQITTDDTILSMDPETGDLVWSPVREVFRKKFTGKMFHLTVAGMDALVTWGHKFATVDGRLVPVQNLRVTDSLRLMGNPEQSSVSVYTDAFVELVGWAVTEGHYRPGVRQHRVVISQNPGPCADRIRTCLKVLGAMFREGVAGNGCLAFGVTGPVARQIMDVAPNKVLDYGFMLALSAHQRDLLIGTMVDGDGWRTGKRARVYCQKSVDHMDAFVALCAMAGIPTTTTRREWDTGYGHAVMEHAHLKVRKVATVNNIDWHGGRGDHRKGIAHHPTIEYDDIVWCPRTDYGTWVCRRNGKVYVTGNTHDDKFANWWELPGYYTGKMLLRGLTQAVCPDFSFYYTQPRAVHLLNVYKSQWLGRFFQEAGLRVIPRVQFDSLPSLKFCMTGIPKNPPVIACSLQNFEGGREERAQRARDLLGLLQMCVDKLRPTNQIIVYGGETLQKQLHLLDGRGAEVVPVLNYVAERRGVAFDKKEGAQRLSAAEKKKIKEAAQAKAQAEGNNNGVKTLRRRIPAKAALDDD